MSNNVVGDVCVQWVYRPSHKHKAWKFCQEFLLKVTELCLFRLFRLKHFKFNTCTGKHMARGWGGGGIDFHNHSF